LDASGFAIAVVLGQQVEMKLKVICHGWSSNKIWYCQKRILGYFL
jgi:hypothetical protein